MKKSILIILCLTLSVSIPLFGQVTMGSQKVPETFSLLELISNNQRGMRLPQLTTQQRNDLEQTQEFQNEKTGLARGLTIFNTITNCMEVWNGLQWINMCKAGTIETLVCASVTGIQVTEGAEANVSAYLPYTGMTGADIPLTDNQSLGSASGLSVQVDGAQTLTIDGENIAIKITGTANTFGTISIPVSLAGASCNIVVEAAQQAGAIGSLGCALLTGLQATQNTGATLPAILRYFDKIGADIILTDNQLLGSASGLSVKVDGGPQTLSAPNGQFNIKITGTAITYGTIDIPITLAGDSCSISVEVAQQGGTIGALNCAAVTGIHVMQGVTANNVTALLPYTGMGGAPIVLTDGMVLGSMNGLSVEVNGSPSLSSPNGDIPIKITGAASVPGTISILVSLAGKSCYIDVISDVNPENLPLGTGTFTGRTCFDVVRINDGGACGTRVGRLSQQADFTNANINTQIYTYTPNGNVSNVRFYAIDPTGKVIQSFTPTGYPGPTNYGTSRTVTVKYYATLNQDAAGLTRTNALKATLYVVYNDAANGNGADKKLPLTVSVQDCSCCPGYLAKQGEYKQTVTPLNFSTANFTTVQAYFSKTLKDLCFYMTDYSSLANPVSNAVAVCKSPTYMDPSIQAMGWRLPNICELGAINGIATNLSGQSTSIQGTTNMNSTPIAGATAYYWSSSVTNTGVSFGWSYGQGNAQPIASNNRVRCVSPQ